MNASPRGMAMFPLGTVLLPGQALPLHVFEPRYKELIVDCLQLEGEPEFGQVLITHGSETGGGDERAMIGTIAVMRQVSSLDANRYALVAVGTRRIRVSKWLADDPYPFAVVEDWPDSDTGGSPSEHSMEGALGRIMDALEQAVQLGDQPAGARPPTLSTDPVLASYQLAAMAPIGPSDRLRLLAAHGPVERLDLLGQAMDDVEAMLKFRLS